MPTISVIICTHNPRRDYLRRTLDALAAQTYPIHEWELLFIDNASRERLSEVWDLSWHPNARHVREERLGLTYARVRGIQESLGSLLVFVDDDNILAPDFLSTSEKKRAAFPRLGVFGSGHLYPEFEVDPPGEIVPYLPMLALRSVTSDRRSSNLEDTSCIPWGAGLCVTRAVATDYIRILNELGIFEAVGRQGENLFCGEDDVFSWSAVVGGYDFGVFPGLRVQHLISKHRLNQAYILRLVHDHAFSHTVLKYVRGGGDNDHSIGPFQIVRLGLHGVRRGIFSMRCNWADIQGSASARRFILRNSLKPLGILNRSFLEPAQHCSQK